MRLSPFSGGIALFVGTIVGAGVFGLPYLFAQTGFIIGFINLAILTAVVLVMHLFFGEIILRTREEHRLIGYAAYYLGFWTRPFLLFSTIIGIGGALLVYITLGGLFLEHIFEPFIGLGSGVWAILLWAALSLAVFRGIRSVARVELWMTGLLIATFVFLIALALTKIRVANLTGIHLENSFMPYGAVLFSLYGLSAVPEVRAFIGSHVRLLPKILIVGTLLPALLYAFFTFALVGSAGQEVAQDAVGSIKELFGSIPVVIASIFGVLAVATSFLALGAYLVDALHFDLYLPRIFAAAVAVLLPVTAFLLGVRDFIGVVTFLGVVFGGVDGLLLVCIWQVARRRGDRQPEYALKIPNAVSYAIMIVLLCGIITFFWYEIGMLMHPRS